MKIVPYTLPLICFTLLLPAAADERKLIDFDTVGTNVAWRTVNDNVMGGKSKGGYSIDAERKVLVFSGSTNTDGGGFSSIRTQRHNWQLGEAMGIEVRVRADDARTYQLEVRHRERSRWVAYRADLPMDPESDAWQTVRVPFSALSPTVMGRPVEAPLPGPADVTALGFMIYDQKDGPFKLEVDWIGTYVAEESSSP